MYWVTRKASRILGVRLDFKAKAMWGGDGGNCSSRGTEL
jgi:hypothetical protein